MGKAHLTLHFVTGNKANQRKSIRKMGHNSRRPGERGSQQTCHTNLHFIGIMGSKFHLDDKPFLYLHISIGKKGHNSTPHVRVPEKYAMHIYTT